MLALKFSLSLSRTSPASIMPVLCQAAIFSHSSIGRLSVGCRGLELNAGCRRAKSILAAVYSMAKIGSDRRLIRARRCAIGPNDWVILYCSRWLYGMALVKGSSAVPGSYNNPASSISRAVVSGRICPSPMEGFPMTAAGTVL